MNRIKTAIVGASGYTGMELLRLLLVHPGVELVAVDLAAGSGQNPWHRCSRVSKKPRARN